MTQDFPRQALDSHIAILGKTGSGKSNAAKFFAEALMEDGDRVCVIDPTGTWWGLRVSKDGKRSSKFSPTIFGGEHADIPMSEHHGAVIAEAIGTSSDSAIIDTRLMGSNARTRFFTAFAETLLRTNKGPLHLIIDEAHLFAPQGKVNSPDAGKMLAEANELVSRGRSAGLRVILISQRPAKLHKDSLTQAETLIAMRLIAPQDRKAIEDWIVEWTDRSDKSEGKSMVDSLASLPVGDAWVWAPVLGHLARMHFPIASTFDSGKALGRDEAAPMLMPLDTTALGDKMDAIRQEAMENSPTRLKQRIKDLEAQKAPLPPATKADLDASYNLGIMAGRAEGYDQARREIGQKILDFAASVAMMSVDPPPTTAPSPNGKAPAFGAGTAGSSPAGAANPTPRASANLRKPGNPPQNSAQGSLPGPHQKIIDAIAWWQAFGIKSPLGRQVAFIAGYSYGTGTWNKYQSALRSGQIIETNGGRMHLTTQGLTYAAPVPATPLVAELHEAVREQLDGPLTKLFNVLLEAHPGMLTTDEWVSRAGYQPGTGTANKYASRLRSLEIAATPERGRVRAADWLFP